MLAIPYGIMRPFDYKAHNVMCTVPAFQVVKQRDLSISRCLSHRLPYFLSGRVACLKLSDDNDEVVCRSRSNPTNQTLPPEYLGPEYESQITDWRSSASPPLPSSSSSIIYGRKTEAVPQHRGSTPGQEQARGEHSPQTMPVWLVW